MQDLNFVQIYLYRKSEKKNSKNLLFPFWLKGNFIGLIAWILIIKVLTFLSWESGLLEKIFFGKVSSLKIDFRHKQLKIKDIKIKQANFIFKLISGYTKIKL